MRTFAPRCGVAEDPACGSMNAAVGQWLTTTGAAPSAHRVSQGARLGRAAPGGELGITHPSTLIGPRSSVAPD